MAALTGLVWIASSRLSVAASESPSHAIDATPLDCLVGQPVEISAWADAWRADRAVQASPEADFIPRRLERLDRIYRSWIAASPAGAAPEDAPKRNSRPAESCAWPVSSG